MICTGCDEIISESNIRWDGDFAYCEDCFSDRFNYCCRCDATISNDNTSYDDDGNPFCDSCWDNGYDDEAPNNPAVYESDRDLIIKLCRAWLNGKTEYKRLISINEKDYHLKTIKDKVGLVDVPIYLFGLINREEYQISASLNIIEDIKEALLLIGIQAVVNEGIGSSRLGISLSLRENNSGEIVSLIKQITSIKELTTQ